MKFGFNSLVFKEFKRSLKRLTLSDLEERSLNDLDLGLS